MAIPSFNPIQEEELFLEEAEDNESSLVLFNDDFNTFDFVIDCLIEICEHTPEQAEQCSILVHYKGKCVVKSGSKDDLTPRCKALLKRGLTAEVH